MSLLPLCANLCVMSYKDNVDDESVERLHNLGVDVTQNIRFIDHENAEGVALEHQDTLFICWRGTNDIEDALDNIRFTRKVPLVFNGVRYGYVHKGFYCYYEHIQQIVQEIIRQYVANGGKKIVCTGHSLGSCVMFSALECAIEYQGQGVDVVCVTFGSPRLGDLTFRNMCRKYIGSSTRVVDEGDVVTKVPLGFGYFHVDKEYTLKGDKKFSWMKTLFGIVCCSMTKKIDKENELYPHSLDNYISKLG
jgi:predicted lipase